MDSKIVFGKCLKELMGIVELKNSKVAKALNVDASLIYKWLNDKSVPPCNSPYIDLMSDYIVKNIINSYQFNAIKNLVTSSISFSGEINENNMLDAVRKLLLESQGYTVKMRRYYHDHKPSQHPQISISNAIAGVTVDHTKNLEAVNENVSSNVEIIKGYKEVLDAALKILETANAADASIGDPILITFVSDMSRITNYPEFNAKWKTLLKDAVKKGWEITCLLRINNNSIRNLKIVDDMLALISTGRYKVYYTNNIEHQPPMEIIIIPKTAALFCVSSGDKNHVDSAFLIDNKDALTIFKGYFYQIFASAKPLLKSCLPLESAEFQREYAEIEDSLGKRFCLKAGLCTTTIPLELYRNYLSRSRLPHEEQIKKLLYHERRIKSFEAQVTHYKFRYIIPYEYIDKLVNNREYTLFDKYYIDPYIKLSREDIIGQLSYTLQLLKKYENFEIGLAYQEQIGSIPITNWIVKENSAVTLITYGPDTIDAYDGNKETRKARGFTITEPNMIKAFESYFDQLWNKIEPMKKSKREIINFLEQKLKTI